MPASRVATTRIRLRSSPPSSARLRDATRTTSGSPRQPLGARSGSTVSKLFGIPIETVLVVLLRPSALALGFVAILAARNRVFFRLGVRNVRRRPGRTALIVAGSMLGTTIIAAALATGDTMSQTIRSAAVAGLGRADEVVAARGVEAPLAPDSTGATGVRYFPQRDAARIARAAALLGPRRRRGSRDRRAGRGPGPDLSTERATCRALRRRCALAGGIRPDARATRHGLARESRAARGLPQRESRLEPRRPERRFPAHPRRARRGGRARQGHRPLPRRGHRRRRRF